MLISRKSINISPVTIYQSDYNLAPDAFYTFLYLKSKKILEKPIRYGPLALPKLKKPVFLMI